jgi:hypothetical protein
MRKRKIDISVKEKEQLKKKVDNCERLRIAKSLNILYDTLSKKLNGILPLGREEAKRIFQACKSLKKS